MVVMYSGVEACGLRMVSFSVRQLRVLTRAVQGRSNGDRLVCLGVSTLSTVARNLGHTGTYSALKSNCFLIRFSK